MKPKDINLNVPVGDDPNKNADAQAMARAERDAFEAKRGKLQGGFTLPDCGRVSV